MEDKMLGTYKGVETVRKEEREGMLIGSLGFSVVCQLQQRPKKGRWEGR